MTDFNEKHCIIKDITSENTTTIITLSGEIDLHCTTDLRTELMMIMNKKPDILVVDMTEVTFMDSSGLAVLVETLQWSRNNDKQLKLIGLHPRVRSIFEISRLESMFEIYPNQQDALS